MANGSKKHNKDGREIEKRSVSAPANLLGEADRVMRERRITNFSEYVRELIRRDLASSRPNPAQA